MLSNLNAEGQSPCRHVPIVPGNPIDSKIVRWFNDTIGIEGRDWSIERAHLARRPVVMLRTQHQEELFRNRWYMICL